MAPPSGECARPRIDHRPQSPLSLMHLLLLATPAKVPADAPYDPSLIRHCHFVGYCRSPGLWLFPQSVLVCRMPLWSGLVVRLLAARFGRRLDAVRCSWSPPRSGMRPARCTVRRLYPCAVRLPDWSPHAYIRMKISTISTRTPTTNHPSPGKLMSWVGPPRITSLLPRSYRVAGSTVSRYVSNAGRSIYWSPPLAPPGYGSQCSSCPPRLITPYGPAGFASSACIVAVAVGHGRRTKVANDTASRGHPVRSGTCGAGRARDNVLVHGDGGVPVSLIRVLGPGGG
jgi:hypothetical protein